MKSKTIGLDIGTSFLIAAAKDGNKEVYNIQRDCYFVIPAENKRAIKIAEGSGGNFIYNKDSEEYYLIGQDAINFANLISTFLDKEAVDRNQNVQLRRPMSQGVLNPRDRLGAQMLEVLIEGVIGGIVKGNDDDSGVVFFSVPADPVDGDFNTIFHTSRIEQKLEDMGYEPHPLNEGLAVIYSEAPSVVVDGEEIPFSGIGISCLCPGTKVYTDGGIVSIEDVQVGDNVITHKGRWQNVYAVITKKFSGIMTRIKVRGCPYVYDLVDNHKLYIKRHGEWQWVGCEEIEVGDVVGEPIVEGAGLFVSMDDAFIEDGFRCSVIESIEQEEYDGIVYDLKVKHDHSFAGPFMIMHNCGGGMVNVCFAYRGMPLLEYSTSRAGDWIDEQVAKVTNTPVPVVTKYKEENLDLSADDITSNEMLNALYIFYDNLIKYVLHHLKKELAGMDERISYEVPIVVAGGTSKPKGFVELFKTRAAKERLPFTIKEVIQPKEPSYAVAKGCLVAALAEIDEADETNEDNDDEEA